MKKKQHPLHLIALEFMQLFPKAKFYGRVAMETQLQQVMEEGGWDAAELLWRIRQWARTRKELEPSQLLKPLPKKTMEEAAAPPAEVKKYPKASEEWLRRTLFIYEEVGEVDI